MMKRSMLLVLALVVGTAGAAFLLPRNGGVEPLTGFAHLESPEASLMRFSRASVGNDSVSVGLAFGPEEARGTGVVLHDKATNDLSFVLVAPTRQVTTGEPATGWDDVNGCTDRDRFVDVGPAGFVVSCYASDEFGLEEMAAPASFFVSPDGEVWSAHEFSALTTVFSDAEGFLAADGAGPHRVGDGPETPVAPWSNNFVVTNAAATTSGILMVIGVESGEQRTWLWDGNWSSVELGADIAGSSAFPDRLSVYAEPGGQNQALFDDRLAGALRSTAATISWVNPDPSPIAPLVATTTSDGRTGTPSLHRRACSQPGRQSTSGTWATTTWC
jgi:hypothetical protein